jgi:hypothetical protein
VDSLLVLSPHIAYNIWRYVKSAPDIATSRSCWMVCGHCVTSSLQNRRQGMFLSGSVHRATVRSYKSYDGRASGPFVYLRQYGRYIVTLRKWINKGCEVFFFLEEICNIWHRDYRMTVNFCIILWENFAAEQEIIYSWGNDVTVHFVDTANRKQLAA